MCEVVVMRMLFSALSINVLWWGSVTMIIESSQNGAVTLSRMNFKGPAMPLPNSSG